MLDRLYAPGTFNGDYISVGDTASGDILSAHEWGPLEWDSHKKDTDPGEVNMDLARMVLEAYRQRPRPIIGTEAIDTAIRGASNGLVGVTHLVHNDVKTDGEVKQLKRVMNAEGYAMPVFFAHAQHVGRVTLHAVRHGIADYVVPQGLPKEFRPESRQRGIRSRKWWAFHELIGAPILKAQRKI